MSEEPQAEVGPSLQATLLRLLEFWAGEGCLLIPPCDFEVAAGTFHPETFFRLLGPEPWRAAYPQPVRRPLDGRRRGHPYRLAKHLQFQVLLKPPPRDLQALYLRSLEAAGLELAVHDVRFTEWRWRSRALAAWGAGWQVLLDGLGITRITFVRHAAGLDLDPVSAELTYGLERLTMLVAGAATAADVAWSEGGPDCGALRRRDEAEFARYAFEVADPEDRWLELERLERESRRCLEAGLVRPAYELAVKGLLSIEILEARGELAARERADRLERIRQLAAAAAERYLGDAEIPSAPSAPSAPFAEAEEASAEKPRARPARAKTKAKAKAKTEPKASAKDGKAQVRKRRQRKGLPRKRRSRPKQGKKTPESDEEGSDGG